jgi:NADPH:quinone reductase-like Zn-dependent oxidoreductase
MGQSRQIPVIHIVRREAQVELLRSMGAEHILNSTDADFDEKLHSISHRLRATLILDPVGGEQTQRLLNAAPGGSTALVYGSLSGIKNDPDSQRPTDPTKHIEGFYMPDWLRTKNILQVLWNLRQVQRLSANELHTTVQRCFPLDQVQEALELYQANPTAGKVLLIPNMK